jgi:hypothetical protein
MGDLLEALTREMLHDTVIRNAGLEKLLRWDLALGVLLRMYCLQRNWYHVPK